MKSVTLRGNLVRLEPLGRRHVDGLVQASSEDPGLYQWSPVPQGRSEALEYVRTALAWKRSNTALPFAIVRVEDSATIGSTRFFDLAYWSWPRGHPRYRRGAPDACEIGYTWLSRSAIRTGANTEAKLLMLTHAFEVWKVYRVCFHSHVKNESSRAAIERLGARFEGILRSHRMSVDYTPRDSARYSIISSEWPSVKEGLVRRLERGN